MRNDLTVFWFRRDLRLNDNAGLYHALKASKSVFPLFIFDTNILDDLNKKDDPRVQFIHNCLKELKKELRALGSDICILYGEPEKIWAKLLEDIKPLAVYTNTDYEPYGILRDRNVEKLLNEKGIALHSFKDHVVFEKKEVTKKDGLPYTVFTPYKRVWLAKLDTEKAVGEGDGSYFLQSYPSEKYFDSFYLVKLVSNFPSLEKMGFVPSEQAIPPQEVKQKIIKNYDQQRDFPGIEGTSKLGIHFRFGTISIREKARKALKLNTVFLSELIWRDFYAMILYNFPHVITEPFREKYNKVEWRDAPLEFDKWCKGQTGYPLVDAGMRQLNATGYMHNRVRMVVASFLTKHLLMDWRKGEAYFAEQLLDFDLASNNGGWQWAAGCGTDAAPYFRIFNPTSQQKKFDKQNKYILQWVPEWGTDEYPKPMVDHAFARNRCLNAYKEALS